MLIGHRKEFIKLTFRALSEGITKNLCSSALDSLYIVERFTYGTNGLDVGLMQLERKVELKCITHTFIVEWNYKILHLLKENSTVEQIVLKL